MFKPYGVIYKITSIITNKSYYGQTTKHSNPFIRINAHFRKTTRKDLIYESFKKYGKSAFQFELVMTCFTKDDLNYFERYFITNNTLVPNGYNIQNGGDNKGKLDASTIRLMSAGIKRWYQNNSHPFKGKKFSEEHRTNLSKVRKGFNSPARLIAARNRAKTINIQIKAINIETKLEYIFSSIAECAHSLSLNATCVSRTLKNQQNRSQHKGYRFERI